MLSFGRHVHDDRVDGRTLAYEPVEPHALSRQRLRKFTWRLFWIALTVVVVATGWRFAKQAQYLYWQHQCMTHREPPDTVVFADGKPVARAGQFRAPILPASAWVFMHERSTPGEQRILVTVQALRNLHDVRMLDARVCLPATLVAKSRLETLGVGGLVVPRNITIYAGQADPGDRTHFTIDYELGGQRGVIDGWVLDSGEVKLEPRGRSF